MLRGALATPTRSDDAAGTVVIGTVLTLLSWVLTPAWLATVLVSPVALVAAPLALAPALVVRGYYVRVVAGGVAAGNADGAPRVVGWGRLYRDGIKSVVLSVVYLLPLVVALAGVGVAAAFVRLGWVDVSPVTAPIVSALGVDVAGAEAVLGTAGAFVGVLSIAYLVGFAYVRPAALASFAATGRLRDGFRPIRVGRVAISGDYAVAWSLAAVTLITGYVLAAPFVPLLVGIAAVFGVRVVVHTLYGRGAVAELAGARETRTEDTRAARTEDTRETRTQESLVVDPRRSEPRPAVQAGRSVGIGRSAGSGDSKSDTPEPDPDGPGFGVDDLVSSDTEVSNTATAEDDPSDVETAVGSADVVGDVDSADDGEFTWGSATTDDESSSSNPPPSDSASSDSNSSDSDSSGSASSDSDSSDSVSGDDDSKG